MHIVVLKYDNVYFPLSMLCLKANHFCVHQSLGLVLLEARGGQCGFALEKSLNISKTCPNACYIAHLYD